jgi:enoyl-[acyl-carrier-protein] reductase (NADH)
MSFKRKIKRAEAATERAAAGVPKRGKLLKRMSKDNPKRRQLHIERVQQFALWLTACLINATGAHDVTRVLVDARKAEYVKRLEDAVEALKPQEPVRTLTNADLEE